MKNPERVAELLAELRELADNDFERHRIDVLERDLTAPPVVEQIDDNHQKFDGEIYTKNHKNQYKRHNSIHRDLYAYCFGDIPDGHDIHHIDGDASHNYIENLLCLTRHEHMKLHTTEEKIQKMRESRQVKYFVCEVCGTEFSSYLSGTKYCSAKCQKKLHTNAKNIASQQNASGVGKNF